MPIRPTLPSGANVGCLEPRRRVLDLVHRIEGEAVASQIGERDGEHRHAAGCQISGEALQPRLVIPMAWMPGVRTAARRIVPSGT